MDRRGLNDEEGEEKLLLVLEPDIIIFDLETI
jgi:hypothetical protein